MQTVDNNFDVALFFYNFKLILCQKMQNSSSNVELAWWKSSKKSENIWIPLIRMKLTCNEIDLNIEKDFYESNEGL